MAYGARPVPQNIMNVEFKLFEFMTLKQFLWAFGLIILSGLMFFLLPAPWKVLVPILIVIAGVVVIFVPFNGEPFQEFLSSYMEALISPQRRIWNKKGVVVKSAYRVAHRYQYGNDPTDDLNRFKFQEAKQIKITPEQQMLDVEEDKFIHNKVEDTNKQNNGYKPPVKNSGINTRASYANGTAVSAKSLQTSVNLNKFPNKGEETTAQTLQNISAQQNQAEEVHINTDNVQSKPIKEQNPVEISITPTQAASSIPVQPEVVEEEKPVITNQVPTYISTETKSEDLPKEPIATSQEHSHKINLEPAIANPQPQQNINIQETIQEIKDLTPPSSDKKTNEDFLPKNYIFGTVEDDSGKPISAAAVVLKQGDSNLEITYTNSNGDYQSHYEYKAGRYTLHVNVDSAEFNEITVDHDPIDPLPIIITPRKTKSINLDEIVPQQSYVSPLDESTAEDDGVFTGNYDAKTFDLGVNYDDLKLPIDDQSENNLDINHIESTVLEQTEVEEENEEDSVPTISTLNQTFNSNNELLNYLALQNSSSNLNQDLINKPNTINGEILDSSGNRINNVLINIFDNTKQFVLSVKSDQNGVFYSKTSLNSGFYYIDVVKDTYTFEKFYVNLDNSAIPAKIIRSLN